MSINLLEILNALFDLILILIHLHMTNLGLKLLLQSNTRKNPPIYPNAP